MTCSETDGTSDVQALTRKKRRSFFAARILQKKPKPRGFGFFAYLFVQRRFQRFYDHFLRLGSRCTFKRTACGADMAAAAKGGTDSGNVNIGVGTHRGAEDALLAGLTPGSAKC